MRDKNVTPGKAIRQHCLECVGSAAEVRSCGGDHLLGNQGDENGECFLYPYRLGRGRPSVKTIRKFCLECQGGSSALVADCENPDCSLYQYRLGKNPAFAGKIPKWVASRRFFERESDFEAEAIGNPCIIKKIISCLQSGGLVHHSVGCPPPFDLPDDALQKTGEYKCQPTS